MVNESPRLAEAGLSVTNNENRLPILEMHLGPLPAPQTLREYELLIPGAAAEIIKTASDQALHRRTFAGRAHCLPPKLYFEIPESIIFACSCVARSSNLWSG